MKKFTGLLAIIILLIFSYNGNPSSRIDTYAGEFHVKTQNEWIVNEKDIIIYDDTTILIVPQQLRKR